MTRLEIATRLLAGCWGDYPADEKDEAARDALDLADALLAEDAKRGATPEGSTAEDVLIDEYGHVAPDHEDIDGQVADDVAWVQLTGKHVASRAHAEKIVRAMLAAGRAVKP